MSSLRRWILFAALACFLSGATVGYAASRWLGPRPSPSTFLRARWGAYVDRLVATCGLAGDQVEVLWEILRQHEEALQALQDSLVLSPEQQAQRIDQLRKTQSLVTKLVALEPRQWQRYQAAAMPRLVDSPPAPQDR